MMEKVKRFFGWKKQETADFSEFFRNASSGEMKKLMGNVVRMANEDQRAVLERYERN